MLKNTIDIHFFYVLQPKALNILQKAFSIEKQVLNYLKIFSNIAKNLLNFINDKIKSDSNQYYVCILITKKQSQKNMLRIIWHQNSMTTVENVFCNAAIYHRQCS